MAAQSTCSAKGEKQIVGQSIEAAKIFRSIYGHEKLTLVRECAGVFDKYGLGDLITRTETGPFFLFVSHVYDFAVGEDAAGESRGLADPIKEFAREYKEQMAEADRLAATWRRSR